MVCLEHEVQVSVYGCEVSLSLCLCLQMHTFEKIGSVLVWQYNWYWNQHGDKSLQSAVRTEFEGLVVHYRYVCTLWRPGGCTVFYNSVVWYSYSRFFTDHKDPPLHHIVSRYNSAHIFITFSLIPHCTACCSQIQTPSLSSSTSLSIWTVTCSVSLSQYSIFFYWPSSITFPMQNLIQNSFVVIFFYHFEHLPTPVLYMTICI